MVLRACNRGFAATSAAWLPRLSPGAAAAAKLRGAWNKPSVRPAAPPSDEQLAMRTKLPVPASQVAAPAPGAKAVSGKRRRAAASVAAASNSTKEQRIPASFVRTEFPPSGKEQSRRARLQVPKRYLTDTETGVPMPTTFADRDMTPRIFRARLTARRGMPTDKVDQDAPLSATAVDGGSRHHQYPYRFYQITLRRGLIGLPESTRRVVARLGLTTRHQVVWVRVSPETAGAVLKVKELVSIKLVNNIPPKRPTPLGYTKVGNCIGSSV